MNADVQVAAFEVVVIIGVHLRLSAVRLFSFFARQLIYA
jgi:hypothetical protein